MALQTIFPMSMCFLMSKLIEPQKHPNIQKPVIFPYSAATYTQHTGRASSEALAVLAGTQTWRVEDFHSPSNWFEFWHSGWWYSDPSEKYEFVNWDDDIPNIWENKSHVPVTTNFGTQLWWYFGDL